MKYHRIFSLIIFVILFSSSCKNDRRQSSETIPLNNDDIINNESIKIEKNNNNKLAKVNFFIENSASMFGYVNGFTEYVDVVSDLAEKPMFVQQSIEREFYLVNGGKDIEVNKIGNNPTILKDKLNPKGFNIGDITKSNLNAMLQLAMQKAKNDTISILISDGLYDIGKAQAPLNALSTKGKETRSRFIERLSEGDLQTIILKMNSHFEGNYYPVKGGIKKLSQNRPYYIWIFGNTELLNDYFSNDYNQTLKGFQDSARFLKVNEIDVPFEISSEGSLGRFREDRQNKNTLIDVEKDRNTNEFQFSIAVDYSNLPFSNSYLLSKDNYKFNNNYIVENIKMADNANLYGLSIKPTHLLFVKTDKNPYGELEISLENNIPDWISDTNSNSEDKIVGDEQQTFGFKFLTDGIYDAYEYINNNNNVVSFKLKINK